MLFKPVFRKVKELKVAGIVMKKRSQSTFDLFVLVGFVLLLIAPITVYIIQGANNFREIEITESLSSLKENVQLLRRLGPHSAQQVILKFPSGAKVRVEGKEITVDYNGQVFTETLPVELKSVPLSEGIQTVDLYMQNANLAVIKGCENDNIDVVDGVMEKCDMTVGECILGRSSCVECKFCACDENEDCKSGYCDVDVSICKPCRSNNDCSRKYKCEEGVCVEKTEIPPPIGS